MLKFCKNYSTILLKLVRGSNKENGIKEKWGIAESLRVNPIFVPFSFVFGLVLLSFYLSLTIFFLNAIMVNIMLEIINRIIEIKPKPATLLKE